MTEVEKRIMRSVKVRSNTEDDEMIINGYALKFNTWSDDLGGFVETISPDALSGTDLSDVRCLIDHEPSQILGRTTAGTLSLEVDDVGLKYTCKLPNTVLARDIYENIKLGNVDQCSFGFVLADNGDSWVQASNGIYKRTLTKFRELTDVSVVTYPAYRDTNVAPALRTIRNMENDLERERLKVELDLL